MNADQVNANGALLTGPMKEKWSALTDDDLAGIAGQKDRLVGRLRERYGYGKEQAEQEAEEFLRTHPGANGGASPQTAETAHVPPLPPPAHRAEPSPGAPSSSAPLVPLPSVQDYPLADCPGAESPPVHYAHSRAPSGSARACSGGSPRW